MPKEKIIKDIFDGKITPRKLPGSLYNSTAEKLLQGVNRGSGLDMNSPATELAEGLRENIYLFSGAKTFQQTLEMSDKLTDENGVRSFKDFRADASEIFDTYNETWLKTEYDTAISQGRMAEKWDSIQTTKKDQPYLQYQTTEDDRVCEICEPLNSVILPVDDPFWDENYPINHFGCECTVIQLDEDGATEAGGVDSSEDAQKWAESSQENKNPMFNHNSGQDREIFKSEGKDKHAYFDVPKEYKSFAERNFDLPIPD